MTEVLFILTVIFVAYVVYKTVNEQKETPNPTVTKAKPEVPNVASNQPMPEFDSPLRPSLGLGAAAAPKTWYTQTQRGVPSFRQDGGTDGKAFLYITATGSDTIASWRSTMDLEPGTYRFEGKIRTKSVQPISGDSTAGADLRISGGTQPEALSGTADWRAFAYQFSVNGAGETELVCELRRSSGEVCFDRSALRVIRVR